MNIYRSFEQWKNGGFLEHGAPRTEEYTEEELRLVEMGWNYGYDAGRAVEQALDKKAENARELGLDYEPAPVQEKNQSPYPEYDRGFSNGWDRGFAAAQPAVQEKCFLCGERVDSCASDVCPKAAQPVPVKTYHDGKPWPVQPKPWVGLTDEEVEAYDDWADFQVGCGRQTLFDMVRDIEAKLKEKNHV
jgi:hypothetical protein